MSASSLLLLPFRLALAAITLAVPVLAIWIATSWAAFLNGPVWATALVGVLLFPVIPFGWDAWSNVRWRKKRAVKPRVLKLGDRIILRTLLVSGLLLGGLLWFKPALIFTALSARGDWMLDGRSGPAVQSVRNGLFVAADRLEWLYQLKNANPYDLPEEAPEIPEGPPVPQSIAKDASVAADARADGAVDIDAGIGAVDARPDAGLGTPDAGGGVDSGWIVLRGDAGQTPDAGVPDAPAAKEEPQADPEDHTREWPLAVEIHPSIKTPPPEAEASVAALSKYIEANLPDELGRVRAVHDWISDRIVYDSIALAQDEYPPYEPNAVFASRSGVCAGYAKLFQALLEPMGIKTAYVSGQVRQEGHEIAGQAHAWNAVRIDGHWYLVDTTWDSPNDNIKGQRPGGIRMDYFLTPPKVFGLDHYPAESKWQLRDEPLSRGAFIRQPAFTPTFYRLGAELLSPKRSQVQTAGAFEMSVKNPKGRFFIVKYGAKYKYRLRQDRKCVVEHGDVVKARCPMTEDDVYQVRVYSGEKKFGDYEYVGQFEVANSL